MSKPTKSLRPRPSRSTVSDVQLKAIEQVGENAAPDDPTHLMPSPQANGGNLSIQEDDKRGEENDLTPQRMQELGYPDPEITDVQSMSSTREPGGFEAQVSNRVAAAHKMLDEKLDEVVHANHQAHVSDGFETEDDVDDFSALPGAPKDGIILGPGEQMRVTGDSDGTMIVLDKSVYRAHRPFRTKRWQFTLEHVKGTQIPVSLTRKVDQTVNNDPNADDTTDPKVIETK